MGASQGHSHGASGHGASLDEAARRLRRRGLKLTGPRRAVLEALHAEGRPMTHKEILAALPGRECDLATIYRSVRLLEEEGIVARFDFGDGAARFEMVGFGRRAHHHHLICTGCAKVVEIEECFPSEMEREIARRNGFKAVTHKLEFFGVCPGCQIAGEGVSGLG